MSLQNKPPTLELGPEVEIVAGLSSRWIGFPAGPAQGRAVTFHLDDFDPRICPFYELINKSFNPRWGYCPPPGENLGVNVPQLLRRSKPEAKRALSRAEVQRCVFACNTIHANFVRGNGFVIVDGELTAKPAGAVALDGSEYRPLGYHPDFNPDNTKHFAYQALVLAPGLPDLQTVRVNRNTLLDPEKIQMAISGPALVRRSENAAGQIPVRMKTHGQTFGDELNFDPLTVRTSATAFGIVGGSNALVAVSMFAGRPQNTEAEIETDVTTFIADAEEGITLHEMAELIRRELNVVDAIAGGGSGDAQQYVYGQGTWVSQARPQPDRPQVAGLRGLGAIFALLKRDKGRMTDDE
jgi:hypothetical protein